MGITSDNRITIHHYYLSPLRIIPKIIMLALTVFKFLLSSSSLSTIPLFSNKKVAPEIEIKVSELITVHFKIHNEMVGIQTKLGYLNCIN